MDCHNCSGASGLIVYRRVSLRAVLAIAARVRLTISGAELELPTSHRLPLSWLLQAASPPIQYRAYAEIVPAEQRDPQRLAELRQAALDYPIAKAIARKQRDDGLWGNDLLTVVAPTKPGMSDLGTIYQYRRLLEMGWPNDLRPFRIADRFLFRLLSRDEDPLLLAEFQRPAKTDPGLGMWARAMAR